jgi:hypothetical protein
VSDEQLLEEKAHAFVGDAKYRLAGLLEALQYPQPEWPSWAIALDLVRELRRRVDAIQADAQKALDARREADAFRAEAERALAKVCAQRDEHYAMWEHEGQKCSDAVKRACAAERALEAMTKERDEHKAAVIQRLNASNTTAKQWEAHARAVYQACGDATTEPAAIAWLNDTKARLYKRAEEFKVVSRALGCNGIFADTEGLLQAIKNMNARLKMFEDGEREACETLQKVRDIVSLDGDRS